MNEQSEIFSIDREQNAAILVEEVARLRRERFWAIVLIVTVILATTFYGTLKNPFTNTFSKIGNYYGYRGLYIVWAIIVSICLQTATLFLFKLTHFDKKWCYLALSLASFFLIVTAIIPSIKEEFLFLHVLHKWTTFLFVMAMVTAFHPFLVWLSRKVQNLKALLRNWQLIILSGSLISLLIQGQTGIFELWFFWGLGTLMIYLIWILFTEKIDVLENNEHNQKKRD